MVDGRTSILSSQALELRQMIRSHPLWPVLRAEMPDLSLPSFNPSKGPHEKDWIYRSGYRDGALSVLKVLGEESE